MLQTIQPRPASGAAQAPSTVAANGFGHIKHMLDQGRDVRAEISMIKSYATEMAWEIVDRTMQAFGAMGMTREMPLHMMAAKLRTMRIYDGPTEVHHWVVARNLLGR